MGVQNKPRVASLRVKQTITVSQFPFFLIIGMSGFVLYRVRPIVLLCCNSDLAVHFNCQAFYEGIRLLR